MFVIIKWVHRKPDGHAVGICDAICKSVLQRLWTLKRFDPEGKIKFKTRDEFLLAVRTSVVVKQWHNSCRENYVKQRRAGRKPDAQMYSQPKHTSIQKHAEGALEIVDPWYDVYPDKKIRQLCGKTIDQLKLPLCSLTLLNGQTFTGVLVITFTVSVDGGMS